jgi:hypothetical protein
MPYFSDHAENPHPRHPGQVVTMIPPPHSAPAPDAGQQGDAPGGRVPWRTAGIGVTSLGTSIGIGVALTIISTALFGSQPISDRAFRLLRWIANRPEPPAPGASDPSSDAR